MDPGSYTQRHESSHGNIADSAERLPERGSEIILRQRPDHESDAAANVETAGRPVQRGPGEGSDATGNSVGFRRHALIER